MKITLPELSVVVLCGPSGSGKSSFARKHFKPTEVISSDYCRGLVSDDENDQSATEAAFEVLHFIAHKRLERGLLTVVDATNVREEDRRAYVKLAKEHHCLPVAVVLDMPDNVCIARNEARADRSFGGHVVRTQRMALRRGLRGLRDEGFRYVYVLRTPEEVDAAVVERQPLWNNRKHEHGPFDIIGDVHGCCDELEELLVALGYLKEEHWKHPQGRKAVFVGDLVDRGPRVLDSLRLVKGMVQAGTALCVPGNHDVKLQRWLNGKDVRVAHGIGQSMAEFDNLPPEERDATKREMAGFIDSLVSHYVLDDGKLVVAHAGMKEEYQGRGSGRVREFALYGETSGETDEFGLPVRYNWAAEYRGRAMVVYGHTPVPRPEWLNGTICVDTGCVFGGRLTALRYPEREVVSVAARAKYAEPSRPFVSPGTLADAPSAQQVHDDVLDLADVRGKRIISTRLSQSVIIREEQATAALEVMSRFAVDPRWLIYLPPTMSPTETSMRPGLLEYPAEAFTYFRSRGVDRVVCEEKHMGSRAVVVVCCDEAVARRRFGIGSWSGGESTDFGVCYTRTGRRFFEDVATERALLDRVREGMTRAGLWEELETDWVCLDCELMPWSAKAQALLRDQYAAVGSAAGAALGEAVGVLDRAIASGAQVGELREEMAQRRESAAKYVRAYQQYCWPVNSIDDLKLAPFHLLASEGQTHIGRDHQWHMETLARLAPENGGVLMRTPHRVVNLSDAADEADATAWWEELTSRGGEGMVIKPFDFLPPMRSGRAELVQPAMKCRGREYLRIIYGPEYDHPSNIERLRKRGLAHKRSLAIREFALGVEALERFIRREPLRRVHECVFGVLALESEPVDPRL